MQKVKNIQILSNGSISISYKTTNNNSKLFSFLEKDNHNFYLNIKKKNTTVDVETFSKYKNKYLISK